MPIPGRLNLVTVTGNYVSQGVQSSGGVTGTVIITAPELLDSVDSAIIMETYVVLNLPTFSVSLIATDNTGLTLADGTPWNGYSINENISGVAVVSYSNVRIPHLPNPVDLSALI